MAIVQIGDIILALAAIAWFFCIGMIICADFKYSKGGKK